MWLVILFPALVFSSCDQILDNDNSSVISTDTQHERNYYKDNKTKFHCICEQKTCVRKCCGENETMAEQKCSASIGAKMDIKFYDVANAVTSNSDDLVVFYNSSCPNSSYLRIMIDGKFYLQTNESLYAVDVAFEDQQKYKMYHPDEYCLDYIVSDGEDNLDLKVFLCVQATEEEIQIEQRNSVGK